MDFGTTFCNIFVLDVLSDVMLHRVARELNANVTFGLGLELGLPLRSIKDARERNKDLISDFCDAVFFVLIVRYCSSFLTLYEYNGVLVIPEIRPHSFLDYGTLNGVFLQKEWK